MIIEDGKGNGKSVEINDENMMMVNAIAASPEHHINHTHGDAYTVRFSATPTGAGDCFFYIKNTSDKDMIIEGGALYCEADEYFDIKINDSGTPVGGTDITPVNLNSGSGNIATGTFQNGNDITGLSGGNVAYRIYHANTKSSVFINFEMDIILKKNGVLTAYCQTGTTALAGHIDIAYHG